MAEAGRRFFVVGAQRSGTTLLRLMLDHHPAISCPHEFDFAVERIGPRGELPDPDDYHRFLQGSGSFQRSGLFLDPDLDYSSLVDSLLMQRARGRAVVGMTVHVNLDRLEQLWPGAHYIHLLRDPRDVARSCVEEGWAGSTWVGVERWLTAENQWQLLRDQLPTERYHETRYEELVTEPERELRRICAFLAVPWSDEVLSYPSDTAFSAPEPALASKWRKSGRKRDIQLVEARLGAALTGAGYVRSGYEALPVGPLKDWALHTASRLSTALFRARRFGVGLVVADVLSRRLHRQTWQARVGERMLRIQGDFVRGYNHRAT